MSDLRPGITAILTAHPQRLQNGMLAQALTSVCRQTYQPAAIIVVNDIEHKGAGFARRTVLDMVQTTWMAWLDSDDYWYPNHLQELHDEAERTGAKYVFSWFDGRNDPLGHFGKPFNTASPHHTTITALIDVELAKNVGYEDTADGPFSEEDWKFIVRFSEECHRNGYPMVHLPKRTWFWRQEGQNTSGKPNQGDARAI